MTTTELRAILAQKFLEKAFVKDAKKGYVVAEAFNICLDPDILNLVSQCWADHFQALKPIDAIVGLPDAGTRLTPIVAQKLGVKRILPAKRAEVVPGAWKDVVSYSNESFTMGTEVASHIGFVNPGQRVLVVDDVVAHGSTATTALKALQDSGVEVVGLGVVFDKAWQGGIEAIEEATGIKTYSLVSLTEITADGKIKVA